MVAVDYPLCIDHGVKVNHGPCPCAQPAHLIKTSSLKKVISAATSSYCCSCRRQRPIAKRPRSQSKLQSRFVLQKRWGWEVAESCALAHEPGHGQVDTMWRGHAPKMATQDGVRPFAAAHLNVCCDNLIEHLAGLSYVPFAARSCRGDARPALKKLR